MTIGEAGNFIQGLVKNGVIRGRDTLSVEYYNALVMQARDYLLFQKRQIGEALSTNASVVTAPKDYKIVNDKATMPDQFNVQGIETVEFLTKQKNKLDVNVYPLPTGVKNMTSGMFHYYLLMSKELEFVNKPYNAQYARIYSIAGSDLNDTVSNDLMFMIVQEVMKLGNISEQKRKDTSADGNTQDDYIMSAIRLQENKPNQIV